jgi:hypothetical protein
MERTAVEELVRRVTEDVWTHGKLDVIEEIYSTDHVHHSPGGDLHGTGDMREWVATVRHHYAGLELRPLITLVDGDHAAVLWAMTGSYSGPAGGTAPGDRPAVLTGITISRVGDGLIQESWEHSDMLGLMSRLGAIPEMYLG